MMSLLSQNIPSKRSRPDDSKLDESESDEPVGQKENMSEDDGELSDLDISRTKKGSTGKEKGLKVEEEQEMKRLESLLFGSLHSSIEFGKEEGGEVEDEAPDDSALFFVDRSASSVLSVYEEDGKLPLNVEEGSGKQRKPVWVDEEEEKTNINIAKVNRLRKLRKEGEESTITGSEYVSRLRAQHVKLNPGTEWAQRDAASKEDGYYSDESSESERDGFMVVDNILRTDADLVVKRGAKLLPGPLEYSRLVDANAEDPSSGPINSVQFHRNAQLLLTASLDRRLRFFQIDGKRNTKIQSIFLDDCPIRKASFLPDGSQVIVSGRRKFFYIFDLMKAKVDKIGPLVGRDEKSLEVFEVSQDSSTIAFVGNEGYILLVSSKTKELIGTLKMNGTVRALAFAENGQQLLSTGGDGHIYHWDLRTRTCIYKAVDEGCINGTSLCASLDGGYFAAGSDSGIVNVYNRQEFLGGKRKPIKALENLTTTVNFTKFNNDAQILAVCSGMKKNGMKLIHVPSFTAFSNWPMPNKSLGYPRCLDFSPGGGFMAVGNAAGKVLLYKLHHYQRA